MEKKIYTRTTQECYVLFSTNSGSSILQNNCCTATYIPSHQTSMKSEQYMQNTSEEVRTNSLETFINGLFQVDTSVLVDPQGLKFIEGLTRAMAYRDVWWEGIKRICADDGSSDYPANMQLHVQDICTMCWDTFLSSPWLKLSGICVTESFQLIFTCEKLSLFVSHLIGCPFHMALCHI